MDENQWLAKRFEAQRPEFRAMAFRMLGSASEAEDAVQEAWLRLQRSDSTSVHNLGGWLTTVVGRVCLDILRSRAARREDPLEADAHGHIDDPELGPDENAVLVDQVGLALMVVLDTLGPDERLAFVLHDLFAVPHREIASILDKTPAASKMLASRARRRVQGAASVPEHSHARRREVVEAFLLASREGDFEGLLSLLHPEVTLRSDAIAASMGAPDVIRGATGVARHLAGRAQAARLALVNGSPDAVWAPAGRLRSVFMFTVANDVITAIDVVAEPARLDQLDIEFITN